MTDPAGNETSFSYDNLQRRTLVTLPSPDGAGGQSAPTVTYLYAGGTLLDKITDALGGETTFQYDIRGMAERCHPPFRSAARRLGLRVAALSVVTNVARPDAPDLVDAHEVVDIAASAAPRLNGLVASLLAELSATAAAS